MIVIIIFNNVHVKFWIVGNLNDMYFGYYFLHYFILIRKIFSYINIVKVKSHIGS